MTDPGRPAAHVERHDPALTERGFTLVELLVYMGLMVVVLAIVGGMLVNSTRTESSVRTAAQSANAAQVVARSIGHGIANASGFQVSSPSTGTQLLVARTADGGSTISWSCQGWYFDGSQMYTTRRTPASVIAAPTTESLPTWTTIGDDLSPVGTGTIFTASGTTVRLAFRVGADDSRSPVIIDTSASRPNTTPAVSAPCF